MGKQKGFSGSGFDTIDTYVAPMKCYSSHPQLILGGGKFIGGSCINPVTNTADIYIGFDHGMSLSQTLPWEGKAPVQVFYPIQDMGIPTNAASFKKLVEWTASKLKEGLTVHAGCIGGHGRTGMFLAALYKVVYDEPDSITKVRALYCQKAVESKTQVEFLGKHFGITPAKGAKEYSHAPAQHQVKHFPKATAFESSNVPKAQTFKGAAFVFKHQNSPYNIWGHVI